MKRTTKQINGKKLPKQNRKHYEDNTTNNRHEGNYRVFHDFRRRVTSEVQKYNCTTNLISCITSDYEHVPNFPLEDDGDNKKH